MKSGRVEGRELHEEFILSHGRSEEGLTGIGESGPEPVLLSTGRLILPLVPQSKYLDEMTVLMTQKRRLLQRTSVGHQVVSDCPRRRRYVLSICI